MEKIKSNPILLSLIAAIFLSVSFPPISFPLFAALGLAFLFQLEKVTQTGYTRQKRLQFAFIFTSTWVTLTVWWLYNASWTGIIAALIVQNFLLAICFMLIRKIRNVWPNSGPLPFLFAWLPMEWLLQTWDLEFPWLALGNSLADWPSIYQWYEYTGASGGSAVLIAVGWCLYILLFEIKSNINLSAKRRQKWALIGLSLFIGMSIWSVLRYNLDNSEGAAKIAVIQPNYNPYSEKFVDTYFQGQLDTLLFLSEKAYQNGSKLILWPETSVPGTWWSRDSASNWQFKPICNFILKHPDASLLIGSSSIEAYLQGENIPDGFVVDPNRGFAQRSYNDALFIDSSLIIQTYHKSKLVAGVEKMPYSSVLGYFGNAAVALGGTNDILGSQKETAVFKDKQATLAPIICFESVFGNYVRQYVQQGAQVLAIITNDG